jgi:hypothetical protein
MSRLINEFRLGEAVGCGDEDHKINYGPTISQNLDLDLDWDNNPALPNPCLVPYHCGGRGRRCFILFFPLLIDLMYVDVDVTFINN